MPKAKTTKKGKKEKVFAYQLSIIVNGDGWSIGCDDLLSGFRQFPIPALIKSDARIVVKSGEVEREEILNTAQARRVFHGSDTSVENLAADLTKALG